MGEQEYGVYSPGQSDEAQMNRFQYLLAQDIRPGGPTIAGLTAMPYKEDSPNVATLLPGPLSPAPSSREHLAKVYIEMRKRRVAGELHLYWESVQDAIAERHPGAVDRRGLNFVVPVIQVSDNEEPFVTQQVILSDPADCERIARRHIKKQPNFTPILFHSVIATTDNEHWQAQRSHLNEVFLPKASLSKIFPISLARAKACAEKLEQLRRDAGPYGVQMHEFFLHEAQAQLQLALFGMDEAFMERTNRPIRDAFSGTNSDPNFAKDMCLDMMSRVGADPRFAAPSDPEVISGGKPVFGPLSKSVDAAGRDLGLSQLDRFGNMMLILFAGHDTTAHTMTWLAYELARHPEHQAALHREIDRFDAALGGRDMTYEDCDKLPFLTRCVMETLRMWPAVGAGTFRELQFNDQVRGPDGEMVTLPKGTFVQVSTWMRHRSSALWGPDADTFNPNRAWRPEELWGSTETFKGFNPSSDRFSPFTYAPRDCLGKNFAQMEMRTIVVNVFRRYEFSLSEPYSQPGKGTGSWLANFQGTVGPRDLTPEAQASTAKHGRPMLGMYLIPKPRTIQAHL